VNAAIALAVGMTRSWVALYTLGLPRPLRDGRRAEIDCDLWEQRELAGCTGEPPLGTAAEIAARAVLGMLSDITWRAQAGLSARPDRRLKMNEPAYMRGLVAIGVVVALFLVVTGIGSIADALVQGDLASGQAAFGAISLLAGAAVGSGLLTSRRSPLLGIGLVATGAITAAAAFYWMFVITIPVGLALVAIAYFRGRPAPRRPEPGPA